MSPSLRARTAVTHTPPVPARLRAWVATIAVAAVALLAVAAPIAVSAGAGPAAAAGAPSPPVTAPDGTALVPAPRSLAQGTVWGVDSAPPVTPSFLAQVVSAYGKPSFYGRYLHHTGFSMTASEAAMLHGQGIDILVLDDDNNTSVATTAARGTADARSAVASAEALGVPAGVVIFRDVEAGTKIDAPFVAAYSDAIAAGGYLPGFYENPRTGQFSGAFCGAVKADSAYANDYLFADEPDSGNTGPAHAPAWKPLTLACGGQTVAWQYGLAGGTVPSVDADEALTTAPLWKAVPTTPIDCAAAAGTPRVTRLLFMTVLARCPDPVGASYWTGQLARGIGRGTAIRAIQASPDALAAVVANRFSAVLGRDPTAAETATWSTWLNAHDGSLYLDAVLASSPEFFALAGSDDASFVASAYQHLLGRDPDAGAATYWTGFLARGGNRFELAVSLVDSTERMRALVDHEYRAVLDRQPDTGALNSWAAQLHRRPEPFWFDTILAGSNEFSTLAQAQPPFHTPTS